MSTAPRPDANRAREHAAWLADVISGLADSATNDAAQQRRDAARVLRDIARAVDLPEDSALAENLIPAGQMLCTMASAPSAHG